jgi:hypothetical protein
MVRGFSLFCSALVAALLLVAAALPGLASPPAPAGGGGTANFIPSGFRFADGNTFVDATLFGTVTGTLSGTWTEDAVLVIHPDGSQNTHASGTFFVSTPCGAGRFAFELEAQQPAGSKTLTGQWRSVEQSSNTVSIHTVDMFSNVQNSGVFTYSGQYSC